MGTVSKALKILKYFPGSATGIGLSEISRLTGQNKATTYRHLCELESNSFVEQDPDTKSYRIGSAISDLARLTDPETSVFQMLAQILQAVSEEASCWAFLYSARTPTLTPLLVFNLGKPENGEFHEICAYSSPGVCLHAAQGTTPTDAAHVVSNRTMWVKAVSEFRSCGVAPSPEASVAANSVSAPIFDAAGAVNYIVTLARPRNPSRENQVPLKSATLLAARAGTAAIGGAPTPTRSNTNRKDLAQGGARTSERSDVSGDSK